MQLASTLFALSQLSSGESTSLGDNRITFYRQGKSSLHFNHCNGFLTILSVESIIPSKIVEAISTQFVQVLEAMNMSTVQAPRPAARRDILAALGIIYQKSGELLLSQFIGEVSRFDLKRKTHAVASIIMHSANTKSLESVCSENAASSRQSFQEMSTWWTCFGACWQSLWVELTSSSAVAAPSTNASTSESTVTAASISNVSDQMASNAHSCISWCAHRDSDDASYTSNIAVLVSSIDWTPSGSPSLTQTLHRSAYSTMSLQYLSPSETRAMLHHSAAASGQRNDSSLASIAAVEGCIANGVCVLWWAKDLGQHSLHDVCNNSESVQSPAVAEAWMSSAPSVEMWTALLSFKLIMPKILSTLSGVRVFVETYSDDGINCSDAFSKELLDLGSKVEESFGEHCTHLVWNNGKSKRLDAANVMGIIAVSPLWIEQCKQAKKRASEADFPAISSSVQSNSRNNSPAAPVPIFDKAQLLRSLDSPRLSSSQRETPAKAKSTKRKLPEKLSNTATSLSEMDISISAALPIPLPSFKKAKLLKPIAKPKTNVASQRRSERISELGSSSSDESSQSDQDDSEGNDTNQLQFRRSARTPRSDISGQGQQSIDRLPAPPAPPAAAPSFAVPAALHSSHRPKLATKNADAQQTTEANNFSRATATKRARSSAASVAATTTTVPDDMVDITSTPYDIDPAAIAVVRLDLLPSAVISDNGGSDNTRCTNDESSAAASKKSIGVRTSRSKADREKSTHGDAHNVEAADKGAKVGVSVPANNSSTRTSRPTKTGDNHVDDAPKASRSEHTDAATAARSAPTKPLAHLPALRIAISGFDAKNGDRDSMVTTVTELIKSLEGWYSGSDGTNPNPNPNANGAHGSKKSMQTLVAPETISKVLASDTDSPDAHCTHVVTSSHKKSRSLRILFALARGVPIVTEEWVFACLCASKWESPRPFRVPIYAHAPLGSPQRFLEGICMYVVACSDPGRETVEKLLEILGATVTTNVITATCLLFGSPSEAAAWIAHTSSLSDDVSKSLLDRAAKLSTKRRVVTFKFLCDCIENCNLLTPSSLEHMVSIPTSIVNSGGNIGVKPGPSNPKDLVLSPNLSTSAVQTSHPEGSNGKGATLKSSDLGTTKVPAKKREVATRTRASPQSTGAPRGHSGRGCVIDILPNTSFPSPITNGKRHEASSTPSRLSTSHSDSKPPNTAASDDTEPYDDKDVHFNTEFYSLQGSDEEEWSEDDRYKTIRPAAT